LKQREISVIEYTAKFNKLSHFAPNQVAIEEIRMDHFKQGLKGEVKQIIAGYAYTNFQEMYQRAVKIARIMNETEIKNREKDQVKRKFGPGGSNSHENRNFMRFKPGMKWDKGKQTAQWKPRKMCDQYGRQHPGPCRSFTGLCFGCADMGHKVANCPRATWNNQGNIQIFEIGINPATQRGCSLRDNRSNQKSLVGSRILS